MLITALCAGHGRQTWAKVRGVGWLLAANCGLTCKAVAGCACGCWLRGLQASHWGQGTAPVTRSHELMMRNVWSHEKVSGSGLFAVFPLSFSSSMVYSGTGTATLIVHLLAEAHKTPGVSLWNKYRTESCLLRLFCWSILDFSHCMYSLVRIRWCICRSHPHYSPLQVKLARHLSVTPSL